MCLNLWYHSMFGRNFDKLKTNSALKAVYRVKHHLNWLQIKCHSSGLQKLSCRNNIVTACCLSAGRTAGVCPAFASSAHAAQGRRIARDCPAPSTGSHVIQNKRIWRWYDVVLRALRVAGGLLACRFMRSYAFNILNIPNFLWRLHCAQK